MPNKRNKKNNNEAGALCIVREGFSFAFKVNWKKMGSVMYSQNPYELENMQYQVIVQNPDEGSDRYTFSCYCVPDASGPELLRVFKGFCPIGMEYPDLVESLMEMVRDYADILYKNTLDVMTHSFVETWE